MVMSFRGMKGDKRSKGGRKREKMIGAGKSDEGGIREEEEGRSKRNGQWGGKESPNTGKGDRRRKAKN